MRGGDDADVDLDRLLAAKALQLAVLDHAQQAHLRGQRQLADFVEKQRAAIRLFEPPLATAGGAGERALLVPEQL